MAFPGLDSGAAGAALRPCGRCGLVRGRDQRDPGAGRRPRPHLPLPRRRPVQAAAERRQVLLRQRPQPLRIQPGAAAAGRATRINQFNQYQFKILVLSIGQKFQPCPYIVRQRRQYFSNATSGIQKAFVYVSGINN